MLTTAQKVANANTKLANLQAQELQINAQLNNLRNTVAANNYVQQHNYLRALLNECMRAQVTVHKRIIKLQALTA